MVDLNLLTTFLEAAKVGNLSAVALKERITPSAVSQKIKLLEAQMGKILFIRKRSGVVLNRDGQEFYSVCEALVKDLSQISSWISTKAGAVDESLVITGTPGLLSYELPGIVAGFLGKHPKAFVQLRNVDSSSDVENSVISGKSDLGIIVGQSKRPSLRSVKIVSNNEIILVCSKGHELAKKKSINKDDLKRTRVIWHGDYKNRTFREICKLTGTDFYNNEQKLSLPDMESCKKHALKGLGVAFISRMYVREELKNGELVEISSFKLNKPVYIISRNEKYETPIVTEFKEALLKACKSL